MAREYYLADAFQLLYNFYKYKKECKKEEIVLKKITNKLITNNHITNRFYESFDTRSLNHFMASIKWGESYRLDDKWMDILAPNWIDTEQSLWVEEDEIEMVKLFNDDFRYNWFSGTYYNGITDSFENDSI